jgi:hypothetical protein
MMMMIMIEKDEALQKSSLGTHKSRNISAPLTRSQPSTPVEDHPTHRHSSEFQK